jgi:hypothetical protein
MTLSESQFTRDSLWRWSLRLGELVEFPAGAGTTVLRSGLTGRFL